MPDYIIAGAQKCGTTSLYHYLTDNRYIVPAKKKEVHFFDWNYRKGTSWYTDQFPLPLKRKKRGFITGEASPYYLFHPHAAKRAFDTVPGAKIIVLLRNPVDRAYSHYNHQVRRGKENLSFEEAIEKEGARLRMERRKMLRNPNYNSQTYWRYSYLARGIYVDQLERWMKYFPRKQMLIIRSEDFYKNTGSTLRKVTGFLGVPDSSPKTTNPYKSGSYEPMNPDTRQLLINYFRPHNRRLYQKLNVDFGWDQ
ncbi:hypothetical protein CHM34_03860 [Paludifilum halophilum]|uniref:Sulfotransferase domain-containing protein n=1 Tax=Paludifilum halophilum TaxID=1642702 RepID=A0A235BA36_9BACL|nr:hypothetical protein CHM34_03860 [Paludifilum halophilum]